MLLLGIFDAIAGRASLVGIVVRMVALSIQLRDLCV